MLLTSLVVFGRLSCRQRVIYRGFSQRLTRLDYIHIHTACQSAHIIPRITGPIGHHGHRLAHRSSSVAPWPQHSTRTISCRAHEKDVLLSRRTFRCIPSLLSTHCRNLSNSSDRSSSNKARLRVIILAFIILHLVIVAARYDFQRSKDATRLSDERVVETYSDPDCSKGAGLMVKLAGYWLPHFASNVVDDVRRLPLHDDDIIIASFPKSGTTWVQHITYLITQKDQRRTSREGNLESRFPYLEYVYPGIKEIRKLAGPRLLKTHLPYSMLPAEVEEGKGKVIYIARNPKDVSVSYYHFTRMITELNYSQDFNNFYDKFVADKVPYAPWWKHVEEFWDHSDDENLLFITYEDLHEDPTSCIKKMASFLGCQLTEKEVAQIASEASFTQMRNNPETNYSWWDELGLRKKSEAQFMRKGRVGDWKNYYTAEMSQQVDASYQKHLGHTTLGLVVGGGN